jgi:hypothetical protein
MELAEIPLQECQCQYITKEYKLELNVGAANEETMVRARAIKTNFEPMVMIGNLEGYNNRLPAPLVTSRLTSSV